MPAASPMGAAPHCTRRKSAVGEMPSSSGPPTAVSAASVAKGIETTGAGCAATSAAGSDTARAVAPATPAATAAAPPQ
jgi:hypothetical protein